MILGSSLGKSAQWLQLAAGCLAKPTLRLWKQPNCRWLEQVRQRHIWVDKPRKRKSPAQKQLEFVPCYQIVRRSERKCMGRRRKKPLDDHQYLIDEEKCSHDACLGMLESYDKTRYKPTDKSKRVYQQTWNECVPQTPIPFVCQHDPPHWKRRKTPTYLTLPKSACPPTEHVQLQVCEDPKKEETVVPKAKPSGNPRCLKFCLPYCRKVRPSPTCRSTRKPAKCKKRLTLYPSFSECCKPCPVPPDPSECFCLARVPMCEAWAEYRRRHSR